VVFFGQVLDGFRVDDVKRRFGEMFRLDEAKLEQLFSGARTVIKRSLHVDEAARYVSSLEKIGARVSIEPIEAAAAPAAPAAPAASAAPAPLSLTPIEAKLRAEVQEREARAEAAYVPRKPQLAEPVEADGDDAPGLFGFGFSGRMARIPYAAAGLLSWSAIVWLAMGMALWTNVVTILPLIAGLIALVVWTVRLTVLRLHDINLSGWWVLVAFIPYAGAIASVAIMIIPGTRGDNDHGGPPQPGSALLILMTLLALGVTVGTGIRLVSLANKSTSILQRVAKQAGAPAPAEAEAAAHLRSAAAVQAFREHYWPAPGHKAFAASDAGAWGWHGGAESMQDAVAQALAQCDQNRQPYTAECELVNINGFWPKE
jgi:uncharacterized membrane protein YhaH (DUF805 family)